jgi:hypothetical protein
MALETPLHENKKKGAPSRKAFRQMRERRREGIIKKAYEYSKLCEADVCLGIRLRGSGRVYTFLADPSGFWSSFESQLVGFLSSGQCKTLIPYRKSTILHPFGKQPRTFYDRVIPGTAAKSRRHLKATSNLHRLVYDSEG